LQVANVSANRPDHAGNLETGAERERRRELVLSGDYQVIGEVDACGVYGDPHLTTRRRRRFGLFYRQGRGVAPIFAEHGFHNAVVFLTSIRTVSLCTLLLL
jgi:hypothetical protein